MADRFFQRVANDVLEASEKLSIRLEEGLSALFTGELPTASSSNHHESNRVVPGHEQEEGDQGGSHSFGAEHNGDEADYGSSRAFEEAVEMMEGDSAYGGTPLEGIARSVIGDIMDKQVGPQTAMDQFHAFRHAITWTEPFVVTLLAFHVCMLFTCLYVSRRGRGLYPRLAVMVAIGLLVRSAERLNSYGAQHWRDFATQNYFDGRGIFVAVMLCGPLLLFSFIMLVCFLREAALLLVQVKTAELKKKRRMENGGAAKKARGKKEQ